MAALLLRLSGLDGDGKAQVYNYRTKQKPPPFEIVKLENNLYMAKGEWGVNVGFFIGDDGVFVIDAKATEKGTKKVVEGISKMTRKPIVKIVFTHSDSDCFNGYGAYPKSAEIIVGRNTLKELSSDMDTYLEMDAPIAIYESRPKLNLKPAISFDGQLNIRFGSEQIELIQYGRAHTSGDTVVCFPDKRVAFIGDLVFVDRDPLIQDRKGGYSFGLVTSLSALLTKEPAIQTFVPGHADPIGREKLEEIVKSIEETQAKVMELLDAGKPLEEVKRAFNIQDPPEEEGYWIWPPLALKVYLELTKKQNLENLMTIKK